MRKIGIVGAGSLGTALAQTVSENADIVYMHLRREDLAKIADTLLFFNEVEAAFVVAKIDKDEVGVSARSTGDIDIAKIMEKMNGGGDKYNGATKIGTEPISKVVEKLKSILDKE